MLLANASITAGLVNVCTSVIGSIGLFGIFVLMTADSALIPIPSEATMLFAGFGVATGRYSLFAITLMGVLGSLVGSWIAYAIGYYGRLELLQKHGRVLHVSPAALQRVDRWFSRYGSITVLVARVLPLARTYVSLPAGVGRVPFWRFTVLTVIGSIPWVFFLGLAGKLVKHNWRNWEHYIGYLDYVVVAAVVIGVVYLLVRWRRNRREESELPVDAAA